MDDIIVLSITESLKKMGLKDIPYVEIEVPPHDHMGDLSTPIAMSLAKIFKKPPIKIAEEIIGLLPNKSVFSKIEVAGGGFINFSFSKDFLVESFKSILLKRDKVLFRNIGSGKKIQIEFISANPTGPLHLGHGRGGATGNALANILRVLGFEVEKEYYINDAGRQVRLLGLSVFAKYKQILGVDYPFPIDGYRGYYVEDIAKKIIKDFGSRYIEKSFDEVSDFFIDYSYNTVMDWIRKDLKDFGIMFDTWQSERELYRTHLVEETIQYLKNNNLVYEKDGALWFESTRFGDDKDRVMIKSDGEYTYFTSDIAYHKNKLDRNFDVLINIWGADHHGYISRIKAVIEALGYSKEKLHILLVQMVTLLRKGRPVQMSKRSGEFITLREVINEVGPDITKFIFLTRRPDSQLEFDLDVVKAQSSENPVFYVQYAYARINSIFVFAEEKGIKIDNVNDDIDFNMLNSDEELKMMKKILLFPMIMVKAARTYEPHRITFYLQEISSIFHSYYNKFRVITDDVKLTKARLALCDAIRFVLKEGLRLLGINAPERM